MSERKLIYIKLLHTIIWVVFVVIIFYILYAGIVDRVNYLVFISIAAVIIEGIVLMFNNGHCPLTNVAGKYTEDQSRDNFDIYLPNWLAKYNKHIFTTIFFIGVFLIIFRLLV